VADLLLDPISLGTRVQVEGIFTPAGSAVATDPTAVSMVTRSPSGSLTTYIYGTNAEITRSSAGVYLFTFTPSSAGDWWLGWKASGPSVYVVGEGAIRVRRLRAA